MKKEMTEQEAYLQLAALCAQAEHCQQEMRDKMRRWELDETVQNRIVARLIKERYVDDERFACAFVKDKIRYNKWGRRKVQQALWQKRIDADIQQRVLDEIDEKEYLDVLRPLLKQKRKSIKAESDYELNQKLVRFALGRGFGFDIIRQCLDVDDIDIEDIDDDETD
jgi:regulatory protein